MKIFTSIICLLFISGCVHTSMHVKNATDGKIHVYSSHTKEVTDILPGDTEVVPHTEGKVIIINGHDEVWKYDSIFVPKDYNRIGPYYLVDSELVLDLKVNSTGDMERQSQDRKIYKPIK